MSHKEPYHPEGWPNQPVREPQTDGGEIFGIQVPPLPESLIPIVTPEPGDLIHGANYARNLAEEDIKRMFDEGELKYLDLVEAPPQIPADYAVALFNLAKAWGKNPAELAKRIAPLFGNSRYVSRVDAAGPYLNFELSVRFYQLTIEEVEQEGDKYGEQDAGQGKVVVVDTSSPNIAKYMSVGHLRSTAIGESLSRIYRKLGYTVIRDNHLGDWGTQFGMLGEAVARWGDEYPGLQGENPVQALYDLYVRMNEESDKEKEDYLKQNPDVDEKDAPMSSLEIAGREWFRRLEEGDPDAIKLWELSLSLSWSEFQRVYDLMGVEFEYALGESFYVPMLQNVNKALEEKGIASRSESGALLADLEDVRKGKVVIQKSDGTSLYATRDLATLAARTLWFAPEKILYVVGGEQKNYFKQVFEVFDRLAQGQGPELEHIYFGMISLPGGEKMSTRKGNVIFLEELLTKAIDKAAVIIKEHNPELNEEEVADIARKVGVGAVVFLDLGQGRDRNITFTWEQALSIEGKGAPYIQYAYARAKSIMRKAEEMGIEGIEDGDFDVELEPEKELVKHISKFPEAVAKAAEQNKPNIVADHAYSTAALFNRLYKEAPILREEDPAKRNVRIRLARAAAQVIKNGLDLLGIEVPERM